MTNFFYIAFKHHNEGKSPGAWIRGEKSGLDSWLCRRIFSCSYVWTTIWITFLKYLWDYSNSIIKLSLVSGISVALFRKFPLGLWSHTRHLQWGWLLKLFSQSWLTDLLVLSTDLGRSFVYRIFSADDEVVGMFFRFQEKKSKLGLPYL